MTILSNIIFIESKLINKYYSNSKNNILYVIYDKTKKKTKENKYKKAIITFINKILWRIYYTQKKTEKNMYTYGYDIKPKPQCHKMHLYTKIEIKPM